MRRDLYQSIILGGRGCFQGFSKRLENELKKIINTEINIESYQTDYANNIEWIGASKLSFHPDFTNFMVNSSEFFEEGSRIINRIKFEKYNIFLNLKEIKLVPIIDNIKIEESLKLEESLDFTQKLIHILKQYVTIELKVLANIFKVNQEEIKNIINSLLVKEQIKGEFLKKTHEFKFWITDNPQEIERIKKSLKITIQQSSEILYKDYIQKLKNLEEIKDLKTYKARANELFVKLFSLDEKLNLIIKKTPIPIPEEEQRQILKYWKFIYEDIKEKFRKAIPT